MTRLEAFFAALAAVVLPAPKGRHREPARVKVPAGPSDDTAPFTPIDFTPYAARQETR